MSKNSYSTFKPKLFDISENWLDFLNIEGYVVIRDIISESKNIELVKIFKNEWCKVSPSFDWNDKSTWTTTNSPIVWGKGSAVFNGFGHSEFMWKIRSIKKVQIPFKQIYKTDKIATSFDGFSVFISNKQKSNKWLHQDQRSNDKRLSIQGALNLKPVLEDDAGFVVVPKSHITHIPPPANKDWIMLNKNDPHYNKAVKLIIPKNCLVLWNSKTIHSNTGMSKKLKVPHLNRLTAYITFVPKSRQSNEIKNIRYNGYFNGESTSHWADRHEIKKIPFHLRKRYLERNFIDLKPDSNISLTRLKLI